jgi:Sugar transport protein
VMFAGATVLAIASSHPGTAGDAGKGVLAALGAGVLWGTMYIPYRKAYLTGMNPLSFVTFFTVGELVTMTTLAFVYVGPGRLWHELLGIRAALFWLMLGGFLWVIGDLFQQYATKYVGISRGIPLSNTNQLWGLAWGVLVYHELQHGSSHTLMQVIGGSVLMALGALAVALSSATGEEHASWQEAAEREGKRYGIEDEYIRASLEGRESNTGGNRRVLADWILIGGTTAVFVFFAAIARQPQVEINLVWTSVLAAAMLALLATCALALWRTTRFR